MSYQATEASVNSGKPVELYEFYWNNTYWRYTSGPEEVDYLGWTYTPTIISRDKLEITDNNFKNELRLFVSRDNSFARQFIYEPLDGPVSITVYRGHGTDFTTFWIGILAQFVFNSNGIKIVAKPKTSGMARTGLRRKYQKLCTHPLYGTGCTVNQEAYKIQATIAAIDGTTITSLAFSSVTAGWLTAGKFIVGSAQRLITAHSGSTITINRPMLSAEVGANFSAYAGCDRTRATCRTKFSNYLNYGGQPWIPIKNPFQGDAII